MELLELKDSLSGMKSLEHADLGWTKSILRVSSKDEFILVDAAFARLARVQFGAPLRSSIERLPKLDGIGSYSIEHPALGTTTADGGFIVRIDRIGPDQLIFVNGELQLEKTLDLPVALGGGETLRSISKFISLDNGEMLVVGFIETSDTFDGYLVRVSEDLKRFSKIGSALPDEVERFYIRDFSPLTNLGNTGYVLVMEEVPWIGRIDPGADKMVRLPDFPVRFRQIPSDVSTAETNQDGTSAMGTNRMHELYDLVEQSQMPIGILGWDNRLFILAKERVLNETVECEIARDFPGEGHTNWFLVEVDPATGGKIADYQLPTDARHLTISPGEPFALLEKGQIHKISTSNNNRMRLFRNTFAIKVFSVEALLPGRQLTCGDKAPLRCTDIAVLE